MADVAVVTPFYNSERFMHRCIESVLSQADVSVEYYLIDDGSTDNSASIARYYQEIDRRITLIEKCNQGQGAARNIGLRLADSKYIYFVDSDDYLGDATLSKLYRSAEREGLDLCSPSVPKHYFDKPLEFVSCVPCKSQFIRLDLIREEGIEQPHVRSGQDGVFSHLVLTKCSRIGMARDAEFNYTASRAGSTFQRFLGRHDLVPSILSEHYDAIAKFYNQNDLWQREGLRLLSFIVDESVRNRIDPHWPYMSVRERWRAIEVLAEMAQTAYDSVGVQDRRYVHEVAAALATWPIEKLVQEYQTRFIGRAYAAHWYEGNGFWRDGVFVTKQVRGTGDRRNAGAAGGRGALSKRGKRDDTADMELEGLRKGLRATERKIDLVLNGITNAKSDVVSAIRSPAPELRGDAEDVVVSMTTVPYRLGSVHKSIESIFDQTSKPSQIILWVTDQIDIAAWMTSELRSLVERGLEIRMVEDVGPHTKLIFALKEFPDKTIVTMDDDVVYPANTLRSLMEVSRRWPGAVVANWARELDFDENGEIRSVRDGQLLTPPQLESSVEQEAKRDFEPSHFVYPYGTSGVLYPPRALHPMVFDSKTFRRLCPKEDDIWFKAMALLNGTRATVTDLGINPRHHLITESQGVALRHENHGDNGHLNALRAVFDELKLYQVFENSEFVAEKGV